MPQFDLKRLVENIYSYAKERGIKIGDLETSANVSQGYLSRLKNKEDGGSVPNVEVIAAIAECLKLTVDELLYSNNTALTPNEKRVTDFLVKLLIDTREYQLEWERETLEDLENVRVASGCADHPLFVAERKPVNKNAGCSDSEYFAAYESLFSINQGDSVRPVGDGFKCRIDYHTSIYLEQVRLFDEFGSERSADYYELYLNASGTVMPVCCSGDNPRSIIDRKMDLLYNAVAESTSHIRLEDGVKTIIDKYLGYDNGGDNEVLPF